MTKIDISERRKSFIQASNRGEEAASIKRDWKSQIVNDGQAQANDSFSYKEGGQVLRIGCRAAIWGPPCPARWLEACQNPDRAKTSPEFDRFLSSLVPNKAPNSMELLQVALTDEVEFVVRRRS